MRILPSSFSHHPSDENDHFTSVRHQWAFTLPEVLVGMSLAGVLILATYIGILSGFQTIQLTREDLRATQIMVEKLEAIRLNTWDQLHSNVPTVLPPDYFFPAGTNHNAGGTVYSGTVTIRSNYTGLTYTNGPLFENYSDNMRLVTVSLVWTNGFEHRDGNPSPVIRTRSMSTYVSRNGLQSYIEKY